MTTGTFVPQMRGRGSPRGKPAAVLCGDLNLLRCFGQSGITTLVVAWDRSEVTLRSRFCKESAVIAPPTETAAIADLQSIGRRFETRPVLYYGSDALLLLVSRNREILRRHFSFRMPERDLVEALVDKARFCELAQRRGVKVPATIVVSGKVGFSEVRSRIQLPCVFKPSTHIGFLSANVGGDGKPRKALRAETWEEARQCFDALSSYTDSFVIQSYVPGGEENIFSYHAYADGRGRILGEYVGKKIRTYPMNAGISTYVELVSEPRIVELGRDAVSRLGLVGPLKLDYKLHPGTGELYLLEVNPRFTLWNHLGAVSGVNLPVIAYADLTGAPQQLRRTWSTGVRWLSFGNDFRAFYRDYRTQSRLSWSDWLRSYRGEKIYDVFAWSDPVPFLVSTLQFLRTAVTRRLGRLVTALGTRRGA